MANKTFQNFINWYVGTYQGPQPVTILDENGNAFDSSNPLPTHDASAGSPADAAVTNPASNASAIALLKGAITILAQGANAAAAGNVAAALGGFVDGSIVTLGAKADAAVIDPSATATALAFLKGQRLLDIPAQIANGRGFVATTGQITAGSSNTFGACLFHPASVSKNMLIYSCRFSNNGGSSMASLYLETVNQALGNNLIMNNAGGGSVSAIPQADATYATAAATPAGTLLDSLMIPQSQAFELLASPIFVPASTNGGLAVYDYIASAAAWSATFRWIEF